MKSNLRSPESPMGFSSAAIKASVIYDDFVTGTRARRFAEQLAERFDCVCDISGSLWRSELLDCPSIADDASRDAAEAHYLIVSLRGDHVPAQATRRWINGQLDGAAGRGAAMILLLDGEIGRRRVVEATRHYFRRACAERDVPFFSLVAAPPEARRREDFSDDQRTFASESRERDRPAPRVHPQC